MRTRRLVAFFAAFLTLVGIALAAEGGFIATLSTEQQAAAGLNHLSADEQTTLNTFVAREVSLARQGNVKAFAGTFSSRRKPAETTAAGLDRLAPEQLAQLDQLVANAIAAGPTQPVLPQRLKAKDVTRNDRLEIHGQVSLAYGWGSGGREMRAGSIYTEIYDKQTGTTLGIGYSQMSGDGWWGYGYPDWRYAGYDYPYYWDYGAPLRFASYGRPLGFGGELRSNICRRH